MRQFVQSIHIALGLFLVMLVAGWPAQAKDLAKNPARDPVASMLNENLAYDVSFLWFNKLAMARIRFRPGPVSGTYVASLAARTQGLTAFLTRHRRSRYETTMELADGRFRPLRYEAVGSRGTGDDASHRKSIYEFDYQRREIRYLKVKTGTPDKVEIRPMPEEGLSDILTALYNLRAGFVGPLVPGAEYTFPTMVSGENENIVIRVLDAAERELHQDFPLAGQLYRMEVGRDVFGTDEGAVFVWFDQAGRPGRTVVENVLELGDVTGTLKSLSTSGRALEPEDSGGLR
jgi:hypothetical protein